MLKLLSTVAINNAKFFPQLFRSKHTIDGGRIMGHPEKELVYVMDKKNEKPLKLNTNEFVTESHYRSPGTIRGVDRIKNPALNKGLAFTIKERQMLGIHGLLPPVVKTQQQQIEHCKLWMEMIKEPLDKYMYLLDLHDSNDKLFYALIKSDIKKYLPYICTPTVGTVCLNWGLVCRRPRGMYISLYDKGHILELFKNWPERDIRVIVVTDGERVLGLGDLGAYGMGVPIEKVIMYTALAGVSPYHCLPVMLDVGTNNSKCTEDPLYIGLGEKRHYGNDYGELVDEFMNAVVKKWGRHCVVQFEDFGNKNAFRFMDKYKKKYCTFNDDIQGTGAVVLAGILAALRKTKNKLSDHTILFFGAGEANIGVANMCVKYMMAKGMSLDGARKKIWMVDSNGLIVNSRSGLPARKAVYSKEGKATKNLLSIVKSVKPTILIGAAIVPRAFNSEIMKEMAKNAENPIIFALSNPNAKAECTPQDAYNETKGRVIYASGSPFPPVVYKGKTYLTGQSNNYYIFPAIGMAAMRAGISVIGDDYFIVAAEELANQVTDNHLDKGLIYPPIDALTKNTIQIAAKVMEYAYKKGTASLVPEPKNKETYLRSRMYSVEYDSPLPPVYIKT